MAKKDTIDEINALVEAMELDPIDTDGKKADELNAIKADLLIKLEDHNDDVKAAATEALNTLAANAELTKPAAPPPPSFTVADGKSITSRRGIKVAGDQVDASMFHGGAETINDLVERGFIKK